MFVIRTTSNFLQNSITNSNTYYFNNLKETRMHNRIFCIADNWAMQPNEGSSGTGRGRFEGIYHFSPTIIHY